MLIKFQQILKSVFPYSSINFYPCSPQQKISSPDRAKANFILSSDDSGRLRRSVKTSPCYLPSSSFASFLAAAISAAVIDPCVRPSRLLRLSFLRLPSLPPPRSEDGGVPPFLT